MNTHLIYGELIRAMGRAKTGQELNEIARAMFNARLIIDSIEMEAQDDRERAACATKPPVRYTETPETARASGEAWSASEGQQGFMRRYGASAQASAPLASYPFEAMDPWPGEDGGRDGA
jgi:hypothetical protein